MAKENLSVFQRNAQREAFVRRVTGTLRELLSEADASACLALLIHEAATYDVATKKGGLDGSIFLCPEEADRAMNSELKGVIAKLRDCKTAIDAHPDAARTGPISYADLMVAAVQVSTRKAWRAVKLARASDEVGGKVIADNYGTPWPLTFGRVDNGSCDTPTPAFPKADAPVPEIVAFFKNLNNKDPNSTTPFAPKAPFWERPMFVLWTAAAADPAAEEARFAAAAPIFADLKSKYDYSKRTLTRTEYEVDFIEYVEKLGKVGAVFESNKYLYDEILPKLRL